MPLYPHSFIEELRAQADIAQVIQDHVSLKRVGRTLKGLCPFHAEKTPSFHVDREKGFFHCFGCGVGGDIFKFLELHEKVGFQDAVKMLAQRVGLPLPELTAADEGDAAAREALLKMHEAAEAYFRESLGTPAGARARQQLQERGITTSTIEALGLGYAPPARDGLKRRLLSLGFDPPSIVRSGLAVERDDGQIVDRFRGRLMVPIARDTGSIVAFGGRAMEPDQQPKYLNSPETPIYSKSRTVYGLHLTKPAIRKSGYAVIVEGYFDFAQVVQETGLPVVASCGTALTTPQAQLLRRFTSKVVLSFDPDAAGQGAAARSCELLVAEGFQVNVAILPAGDDPDTFIRRHGGRQYADQLRASRPYLEYLLDRAATAHDLRNDDSRREFLNQMLGVAARIPDAAARDQFADRLSHKARITEDVVRTEIRKAAVDRRTAVTRREVPSFGQLKPAERGLIWAFLHEPGEAAAALGELEGDDVEGLASAPILAAARALAESGDTGFPGALLERLSGEEAQIVTAIASEPVAPAPPADCARALKRLRYERERAAVQREIDRLQELGADEYGGAIDSLWERKKDLLHRIETLSM
jgi:DNA primase